jgi:hypothetical protein
MIRVNLTINVLDDIHTDDRNMSFNGQYIFLSQFDKNLYILKEKGKVTK